MEFDAVVAIADAIMARPNGETIKPEHRDV
jgi:hypothetical protein